MLELQNMCRTCGTVSKINSLISLFPTEISGESIPSEISQILDILELNFQKGDGLPSKVCDDCLQTLAAVCEFRNHCYNIQQIFVKYIIEHPFETITNQPSDLVDPKVEITTSQNCQTSNDKIKEEISEIALPIKKFTDAESDRKTNECVDSSGFSDVEETTNLDLEQDDALRLTDDAGDIEFNEELYSNDKWDCEYALFSDDETKIQELEPPAKRRNESRETKDDKCESIPKNPCQFCGKMFRKLNLHIPSCSKRNVELCELCPLQFTTAELLEEHMQKIHPEGLLTCGVCFSTFGTKNERKAHMYKVHSNKQRKCMDCNEIFQDRYVLRIHRLKEHIDVINKECPDCKIVCKTQYEYDKHVKKHTADKLYQCKFCGRGFMQNQHRHHHELTHTGERPFLCEVCGKSFVNNTYLQIHLASSHNFKVKKSYTQNKKPYTCNQCGAILSSYNALKIHIARHQGLFKKKSRATGLPLACNQCPKRFANLSSLENHTKTHLEKRDYVCNECGCSYKRSAHLTGHIRRMHLKERKHICPYCSKPFAENYELTEHMYMHKDERNYKCKFCPRAFKMRASLKTHVRCHTNEKPFDCYICGMHFKTSVMQQAHSSKHSAEEIEEAKQQILRDLEYSQIKMGEEKNRSNSIDIEQALEENIIEVATIDANEIQLDDDSVAIYTIEM